MRVARNQPQGADPREGCSESIPGGGSTLGLLEIKPRGRIHVRVDRNQPQGKDPHEGCYGNCVNSQTGNITKWILRVDPTDHGPRSLAHGSWPTADYVMRDQNTRDQIFGFIRLSLEARVQQICRGKHSKFRATVLFQLLHLEALVFNKQLHVTFHDVFCAHHSPNNVDVAFGELNCIGVVLIFRHTEAPQQQFSIMR